MSGDLREIPGFPNYQVTADGRVWSNPRRKTKGGWLSLRIGKRGYLTVCLQNEAGQSTHDVHRLVARAFLGDAGEGQEVRHLNGNPLDCRVSNLAYGSRSENVRDKRAHGTDHNVIKTHCPSGHPYDEANTYVLPSRPNARYCRECQRIRRLARYHQSRIAA